jgi:hypothetical protein
MPYEEFKDEGFDPKRVDPKELDYYFAEYALAAKKAGLEVDEEVGMIVHPEYGAFAGNFAFPNEATLNGIERMAKIQEDCIEKDQNDGNRRGRLLQENLNRIGFTNYDTGEYVKRSEFIATCKNLLQSYNVSDITKLPEHNLDSFLGDFNDHFQQNRTPENHYMGSEVFYDRSIQYTNNPHNAQQYLDPLTKDMQSVMKWGGEYRLGRAFSGQNNLALYLENYQNYIYDDQDCNPFLYGGFMELMKRVLPTDYVHKTADRTEPTKKSKLAQQFYTMQRVFKEVAFIKPHPRDPKINIWNNVCVTPEYVRDVHDNLLPDGTPLSGHVVVTPQGYMEDLITFEDDETNIRNTVHKQWLVKPQDQVPIKRKNRQNPPNEIPDASPEQERS